MDYRSDKTQSNSTNTEMGSDFHQCEIKVAQSLIYSSKLYYFP